MRQLGHHASQMAFGHLANGFRVMWKTRRVGPVLDHDGLVLDIAFNDAGLMACACEAATVRLWCPNRGRAVSVLTGHPGPVQLVAFVPGTTQLVSLASTRSDRFWTNLEVRVWDVKTGETTRVIPTGCRKGQFSAASGDGQTLAISCGRSIALIDVSTGETCTIDVGGRAREVALSSDGRAVAAIWSKSSELSRVKLWDTRTLKEIASLGKAVGSLAFSSDGMLLAYSTLDQVALFDVAQRVETAAFPFEARIDAMRFFHRTEALAVWAYSPSLLRFLDARTGEERGRVKSPYKLGALGVSDDDSLLAYADGSDVHAWAISGAA